MFYEYRRFSNLLLPLSQTILLTHKCLYWCVCQCEGPHVEQLSFIFLSNTKPNNLKTQKSLAF